MVYIPNTDDDRSKMLKAIGVNNIEELISNIPPSLRVKGELKLPPSLSEFEALKHLKAISQRNDSVSDYSCFIGGGAYDHIIPSLVDHVISRPEFYTAYTPYQAELSQGTLQVMYEFQTCISMLAGLDIANASMYDGASALAEAVIMANNIHRKNKVLIAGTVHPFYKTVAKTYIQGIDLITELLPESEGTLNLSELKARLSADISAVVIQQPNFLGNLEEVDEINEMIKKYPGVQFIVSYNPISVGLLKSPGEYGADIAVAEGQPLGIPLSFGGPYIGLFATKQENIRKMPGRMAGKTIDKNGKEGFVLALQTREQHIKRERATSNICTNQGLMAVAVLTYLTSMGKEGLAEVATQNYNHAHYLSEKINQIPGYSLKYNKAFFNEFVINTKLNPEQIIDKLHQHKILAGVNLSKFGLEGLMIAVTEKRTREEMDNFIEALKAI